MENPQKTSNMKGQDKKAREGQQRSEKGKQQESQENQSQSSPQDQQKLDLALHKTWRNIKLNAQIQWRNFFGCLVHYTMLSFIFVTVDSLQPMLLQQKFSIEKEQQVENIKNAAVIGFDIGVKLLCAPIFGYLADRLGRRIVNIWGITCIASMLFLMPYAPSFEVYVLMRCFYAQGAIAISVIPLLADYVSNSSRGICAALLVFMSSVGAVSSAFINFTILDKTSVEDKIYLQYGVGASIVIILGLLYSVFLLKPGRKYYKNNRADNHKRTVGELWQVLCGSFKQPELVTSYCAAFLARCDSILLSLFLVLWTYSFKEDDYETASVTASALSGITYTVIMLSCVFYGWLYQKTNHSNPARFRRNMILAMLVLAATGTCMMSLSNNPKSMGTYSALAILGGGMAGLLTASLYLVNQFSSPDNRGYITGIQTFFGISGVAAQTLFGAILYEVVGRNGPFIFFGSVCVVSIILTIMAYMFYLRRNKSINNSLIEESNIGDSLGKNQQNGQSITNM